jgi:hypothetical protein
MTYRLTQQKLAACLYINVLNYSGLVENVFCHRKSVFFRITKDPALSHLLGRHHLDVMKQSYPQNGHCSTSVSRLRCLRRGEYLDLTENNTGRLMKQRKEEFYSLYYSPNVSELSYHGRLVGQKMYMAYTCGRNEKCIHYFCGSPDGKRLHAILGVDGKIILKWISK